MLKFILKKPKLIVLLLIALSFNVYVFGFSKSTSAQTLTNNGSFGVNGEITSPPPTVAATIATPSSGQSFTNLPITVSGICKSGLLIKIYINNIFSGSNQCSNGSYSLSTDLFNGTNQIIAEDFDSLNQSGPNSNTVTVSYTNNLAPTTNGLNLTSNYAKLGANPGSQLSWPIQITGGNAPYALSIDWGDNKKPSLVSQSSSGEVNLTHTYAASGIYNVIISTTDASGNSAILQVVGVANGPAAQSSSSTNAKSNSQTPTIKYQGLSTTDQLILIICLISFPLIAFWLGSKHEVSSIQNRLKKKQDPF